MMVPFCPLLEGDDKMLAAKMRETKTKICIYYKNLKSLTYKTQHGVYQHYVSTEHIPQLSK